MNKVAMITVLIVVGATLAWASTSYSTSIVSVNIGAPGRASFTFGANTNAAAGSTQLIVQCDFGRAELITNFDVYGQMASSGFFPIGCTSTSTRNSLGQYVVGFTVNGTPFTENVTMNGSNGSTQPLSLTVDAASWKSTEKGCGRGSQCWEDGQGTSQIVY